jgi:poly(3-hydroxyoctanoate) depolymerase
MSAGLTPPRSFQFVDVDGVRLRVRVWGDGRPLLLIMGVGGNIEMWNPFDRELEVLGFQTITFDAPGTGESADLRRPRRMKGLARIVEHLLDKLGYERVDVLGVSFGGALAQQLTRQAPGRVRRLVLAATFPGMPGLGGVPGKPSALIKLATPRRYHDADYSVAAAHRLYGGRASRVPDDYLAARLARPPSARGYRNQLFAVQGWTMLPWLRTLRQPTLVLAGDDDPLVPLLNGRILARLIPRARLEVIRGGGHLFLMESAPSAAVLVRDFLCEAVRLDAIAPPVDTSDVELEAT